MAKAKFEPNDANQGSVKSWFLSFWLRPGQLSRNLKVNIVTGRTSEVQQCLLKQRHDVQSVIRVFRPGLSRSFSTQPGSLNPPAPLINPLATLRQSFPFVQVLTGPARCESSVDVSRYK